MTGYTVHTGTSKKFISGWDRVFSDKAEQTKSNVKGPRKTIKSPPKKKKK